MILDGQALEKLQKAHLLINEIHTKGSATNN